MKKRQGILCVFLFHQNALPTAHFPLRFYIASFYPSNGAFGGKKGNIIGPTKDDEVSSFIVYDNGRVGARYFM